MPRSSSLSAGPFAAGKTIVEQDGEQVQPVQTGTEHKRSLQGELSHQSWWLLHTRLFILKRITPVVWAHCLFKNHLVVFICAHLWISCKSYLQHSGCESYLRVYSCSYLVCFTDFGVSLSPRPALPQNSSNLLQWFLPAEKQKWRRFSDFWPITQESSDTRWCLEWFKAELWERSSATLLLTRNQFHLDGFLPFVLIYSAIDPVH